MIKHIIKRSTEITTRAILETRKRLHHLGKSYDTTIIFLMGCQRSGTTFTSNVFNTDNNIKVFDEMKSSITSDDKKYHIRLNDHAKLRKSFSKQNSPVLLAKPLVESQHAKQYLDAFSNLKIIWIYRNYLDVASSNIHHFGKENGMRNLAPILNDEIDNWRNDNLSDDTRAMIKSFSKKDLSAFEAAALFWYIRNSLFFEQSFQNEDRVLFCSYEDMVQRPYEIFQALYDFIGIERPELPILKGVFKKSVGRGKNLDIRDEINIMCQELQDKIDHCYQKQGL